MISGLNEPGPLHRFILEAIDPTFGCPVLEAQLQVADLAPLRTLLGQEASVDVDLQLVYTIGPAEVSSICVQYGIGFEPGDRKCRFASAHSIRDAPYLIHTGYQLFLMLEGVKPFTMFTVKYPVGDDVAEDAFAANHTSGQAGWSDGSCQPSLPQSQAMDRVAGCSRGCAASSFPALRGVAVRRLRFVVETTGLRRMERHAGAPGRVPAGLHGCAERLVDRTPADDA